MLLLINVQYTSMEGVDQEKEFEVDLSIDTPSNVLYNIIASKVPAGVPWTATYNINETYIIIESDSPFEVFPYESNNKENLARKD